MESERERFLSAYREMVDARREHEECIAAFINGDETARAALFCTAEKAIQAHHAFVEASKPFVGGMDLHPV